MPGSVINHDTNFKWTQFFFGYTLISTYIGIFKTIDIWTKYVILYNKIESETINPIGLLVNDNDGLIENHKLRTYPYDSNIFKRI